MKSIRTQVRNNVLSRNTYITLIHELNINVCIFSCLFNGSNNLSRIKCSSEKNSKSPHTKMAHNSKRREAPPGHLPNKHMHITQHLQLKMARAPQTRSRVPVAVPMESPLQATDILKVIPDRV